MLLVNEGVQGNNVRSSAMDMYKNDSQNNHETDNKNK